MKKIIMATLLMGLINAANAQVAISGKVSEYVDQSTVGSTKSTQMLTEPTSNIAVSVNEKLGGGLTGRAVVETSLRGNTIDGNGTKLGDRQSTVGVAHKFGSVDLGRNVHSHFLAITTNDVFGTLYGSIAGDVHNLRNLRLGDAAFVTINPTSNISVAYERTMNEVVGEATVIAASGKIMNINATVSRFEQGAEKSTVVGVNTAIAGNKIAYIHSDNEGLVKSKGDSIGVARDIGNITAKASYGKTDTNITAYAFGADYNLSKRTALHIAYRNVDAAQDNKQIGIGITHKF